MTWVQWLAFQIILKNKENLAASEPRCLWPWNSCFSPWKSPGFVSSAFWLLVRKLHASHSSQGSPRGCSTQTWELASLLLQWLAAAGRLKQHLRVCSGRYITDHSSHTEQTVLFFFFPLEISSYYIVLTSLKFRLSYLSILSSWITGMHHAWFRLNFVCSSEHPVRQAHQWLNPLYVKWGAGEVAKGTGHQAWWPEIRVHHWNSESRESHGWRRHVVFWHPLALLHACENTGWMTLLTSSPFPCHHRPQNTTLGWEACWGSDHLHPTLIWDLFFF